MKQNLFEELVALRTSLGSVHQRLSFERQTALKLQARMDEIEREKTLLIKAVGLIDRAIVVISSNGIGRIEKTVTEGLQLVFHDPTLAFKVIKKEGAGGNRYELEGWQGEVHGPILETFGGGVANVVSFLLRVIMIKRFKLAKFIVIDESFNNVSAQFLPMVSEMLRSLAHDGGYTIFAVTHQPMLAAAADHVYRAVEVPDGPPVLQELSAQQMVEIRRAAEAGA